MSKRHDVIGIIALVVFLVGCGTTTATGSTATPNRTATATLVPSATPLPMITPGGTGCGKELPSNAVLLDGLAITQQTDFGNLAYPGAKLPEGLPLAPDKVGQGAYPPGPPSGPPVDPGLREGGGGFVTIIANCSNSPHSIQQVQARIDSMLPYRAALDLWSSCQTPYSRQRGYGGGCGGGDGQSMFLHAPFQPSDGAGTTVTAQQRYVSPAPEPGSVKLPATLLPGETLTIEVGMGNGQVPFFTAAGYYTFSFGFGIDGNAPVFTSTSPQTLLAPVAHAFNGQNCLKASMQQQIPPATEPPTYYVCP